MLAIHTADRAVRRSNFHKDECTLRTTEASLPMTELATNLVEYFKDKREATWETLVRIVFGTFMGGLVLLLTLLYSGVPIV